MYSRETATAQVSLRDDRILAVTNRGIDPNAADISEIADAITSLVPDGGWPVLWDARHIHEPHAEAWLAVVDSIDVDVTALAIYVDGADTEKFAAETDSVDGFDVPWRMFTESDEAIRWLHTHL